VQKKDAPRTYGKLIGSCTQRAELKRGNNEIIAVYKEAAQVQLEAVSHNKRGEYRRQDAAAQSDSRNGV